LDIRDFDIKKIGPENETLRILSGNGILHFLRLLEKS
jgi:hypothetical protein